MAYIAVTATPGAPFVSVLCPDGTEEANADDIQRVAGVALANSAYYAVQTPDLHTFDDGIIVNAATANRTAIVATANGTGAAIEATGGGTNGAAGIFTGGATNGVGISVTGAGTGSGAVIQGGAAGVGLEASAGGGNTNGIKAFATGTGFALSCEVGGVQFNGAQPVKTADPGANAAHATNQVKAWAHITTDGAGAATIEDGYNIATAVPALGDGVDLAFARAMSNALYAVTVTNLDGTALFGVANYALSSTTSVRAKLFDAAGVIQQSNSTVLRFSVVVHARQ